LKDARRNSTNVLVDPERDCEIPVAELTKKMAADTPEALEPLSPNPVEANKINGKPT